jgi:protein O-GlcNAc transferase
VLWLLEDNEPAKINLGRHASAHGIDPARLIFAPRAAQAEHLARHRCADLFLDTLSYNAHTTGSDALWMGLPLVTCTGRTFAARVGASLLHAVGLPELVAADLAGYETLALELAQDPQRLQALRLRLEQNRAICPLFDKQRFRRHLEAAYVRMWEIWQTGESPKHFRVDPQD